jgi:hypothetical protein
VKYSIPFLYYFDTRINSLTKKIAWAIVNVFPILWLCAMITEINIFILAGLYFLGLSAMMSIYEVGYLENDIITTKNEKNPTRRLDEHRHTLVAQKYNTIITLKFGIALLICICFLLTKAGANTQLYIVQFVISLVLLRVIYLVHNKIRNRYNILTFLGLIIIKHYSIILLFVPFNQSLYLFLLIFILFCGQRLIEYASKRRFGLNINIGKLDVFRVSYYLICLVGSVLYIMIKEDSIHLFDNLFVPVALYLFLFRLLLLLAGRLLGIAQQGNE